MKKQRMISWILSAALLFPFLFFPVFSDSFVCYFCSSLRERGFPSSYCERLCALGTTHPEWEFSPLFVTELSREKGEEYTFSYVLEKECEKGRSLVSSSFVFAPYHGDRSVVYDAGFFDASKSAVAYFLDPRNFLSEKGIFQFLLLSGEGEFSSDGISEVLTGSAVEKAFSESKTALPNFLLSLGKKWDLNPYHLAARLCQEQGREGNALLWGTAGDALEKTELNGYYNPFNISASGNGEEEILRAGAMYAKKMGWNSPEKAIEGGAEKLAREYISSFQNTLYLQKWNVDPRSENEKGSRNFWAQFMQNIGGAKTEGEILSEHLLKKEEKMSFLIPVYEKMPTEPCPDPAKGTCPVFASEKMTSSRHLILSKEAPLSKEARAEEGKESVLLKKEEPFVKREFFYLPLFLALCAAGLSLLEKKSLNKGLFVKK